ncbi:MAG: hypothetical protein IT323_05570 [Anaerolineae bacterium]|nr:hypothetical protein [Anaerolineae bacterium]
MQPWLVATFHDPDGRLYAQITRSLPFLRQAFAGIAVRATDAADARAVEMLRANAVRVRIGDTGESVAGAKIGRARREALALAVDSGAEMALYSDFDRALHWAEFFPEEMLRAAAFLANHDFTIFGRTPRAFATHPRIQVDTEAIINRVFTTVSGQPWDITAGARGVRLRAAKSILAGCDDEFISTDATWPLHLMAQGGFSFGYLETEGMEFETADRYPDQVAAAGGETQWIAQLDADPRLWLGRLDAARVEVAAMLPYAKNGRR